MVERNAAQDQGGASALACVAKGVGVGGLFVATAVGIGAVTSTTCVARTTGSVHTVSCLSAFHAVDTRVIQDASRAFGHGNEHVKG